MKGGKVSKIKTKKKPSKKTKSQKLPKKSGGGLYTRGSGITFKNHHMKENSSMRTRTASKTAKQTRMNANANASDTNVSSNNTSFNDNLYVRESHNCYMYFLNKKNNEVVKMCKETFPKQNICRRAQPGYAAGYPLLSKEDYKCSNIMERTLSDNPNIYKTGENKKCIPSHYKGALVVAPGRDYHYYRQNDDNTWTHKPGYKPSTNLDSKNNFILNPRKASRDYGGTLNYKNFCGYLCVPREKKKKRMSFWKNNKIHGGKTQVRKGKKCRTRKKKTQKKKEKKTKHM